MESPIEEVRTNITRVLALGVSVTNGRYSDALIRLHEVMFWADQKLKEKDT